MDHLILSERMRKIVGMVRGDTAADVGTDHGYIPIWLAVYGKCRNVILTDINKGPLKKARENIGRYLPGETGNMMDLRLGSGLAPLEKGEADTVIIAGMGGILIRDILADDFEKTMSFSRFILQPRNHSDVLREFLKNFSGLMISYEILAKEAGRLCEIIVADCFDAGVFGESSSKSEETRRKLLKEQRVAERLAVRLDLPAGFAEQLPMMYFLRREPYAEEFLQNKIRTESVIIGQIRENGTSCAAEKRLGESMRQLEALRRVEAYFFGYSEKASADTGENKQAALMQKDDVIAKTTGVIWRQK